MRGWMALVALVLGVWLQAAHAQRPREGRPFGGQPGMERTDLVARFDADGDGMPNYRDLDSDGDGRQEIYLATYDGLLTCIEIPR